MRDGGSKEEGKKGGEEGGRREGGRKKSRKKGRKKKGRGRQGVEGHYCLLFNILIYSKRHIRSITNHSHTTLPSPCTWGRGTQRGRSWEAVTGRRHPNRLYGTGLHSNGRVLQECREQVWKREED